MGELSSLLAGLSYELLRGSIHRKIRGIAYHSDQITKDCLFVCIRGQNRDGHEFIMRAAREQAAAVLVEEPCELPEDCDMTVIRVPDTRTALAQVSHTYYGHPARKLITIAITGTKGKTTTACMILSVLRNAGIRAGYIGTLGIDCGYGVEEGSHTTPESYVIAKAFRQMADCGCMAVVLEASSIGLKMQRLHGILFDIGVFLNFGEDHIGGAEHADIEEYFSCKAKLFEQCMIGIFNGDDKHCVAAAKTCRCREIHFFGKEREMSAVCVQRESRGTRLETSFMLPGFGSRFVIPIPGTFNVENALAAIMVCRQLSLMPEQIRCGLSRVFIPGRMENVSICGSYRIYIDYAHNAMALEHALRTLREYRPRRLLCLFGCGGNRAHERRFTMGETSGRLADLSIITSDNPRYEDADAIISDILVGMNKTSGRYIRITDRREAIAYTLSIALPGDVILLAGKGHETYQEINGKKYPMDERRILAELSKGR